VQVPRLARLEVARAATARAAAVSARTTASACATAATEQRFEEIPAEKLRVLQRMHGDVIAAAAQTPTARALGMGERDVTRLLCALHWNM
jgi:hypothetical protein